MSNKKYNSSIDIFRYICALMVCARHLKPFNIENSNFVWPFIEFSVYFFFAVSGYYFYRNLKKTNCKAPWTNIKRILLPVIFWTTLYNIINFYEKVIVSSQTIGSFIKLQLMSLFVNGVGGHLWYMMAMILYMLIVYLLEKNNKTNIILVASIFLFIFGAFGSIYGFLGEKISFMNWLMKTTYFVIFIRIFCMGLPMFCVGIIVEKEQERFSKIKTKYLLLICIGLFVCSYFELSTICGNFEVNSMLCSFSTYLLTYFVFMYLLRDPFDKLVSIRKPTKAISTFLYYSHPLTRTVFASLFARLFNINASNTLLFITVVLFDSVAGYIIYKINNKHLNKLCF